MFDELKEHNQEKQNEILAQLQKGRLVLGFSHQLEEMYSQHIRKRILQRTPMIAITSISFLFIFAILDQYMLPQSMAIETAIVRTLVISPIIFIACFWLYIKPPRFYLLPYSFAFLSGSLSVVWVIWLAHSQGVLLPYEGLMITMMYGFVMMGLPVRWACGLNAITLVAYILTDPLYLLDITTYTNNVMFLTSMYLAGLVSAAILSHTQRNQFLHQELLNLSEERAKLDLKAKNKYLAVASHDLRQPLQAINMMAEQLCSENTTESDQLLKLRSAATSLTNMFDQLLDSSRVNLDLIKIENEPVRLSILFDQIISAYTIAYKRHGIDLVYQRIDECVYGDYSAIQRIMNNLLQNALVHSQATCVEVYARKDGDFLTIVIKDNGCGIAKVDRSIAFEEFTKLKANSKDQGIGVGLSIVKKLVKAQGFELELISDTGCEFRVTMPLCVDQIVVENPKSGESILIIEDDESTSNKYADWFALWGWEFNIVNNIKLAKTYLEEKPLHILTDWNLPDGIGQEILDFIDGQKKQDSSYAPSIIVISANEKLEKTFTLDCEYLVKPITASRLRALLLKNN